jgi:uncharacterized protein YjeT (DUF2065 family)
MKELWSALCLVAVLEGLLLFVAPRAWKSAVAQMLGTPDSRLRAIGGVIAAGGLLALMLVRG